MLRWNNDGRKGFIMYILDALLENLFAIDAIIITVFAIHILTGGCACFFAIHLHYLPVFLGRTLGCRSTFWLCRLPPPRNNYAKEALVGAHSLVWQVWWLRRR